MSPAAINAMKRQIPGHEGRYSAFHDGRIWSHITNRFLKAAPHDDGYHYVTLRKDGRSLNRVVHRLVCAAWHGEPADGMESNHKDLNKTNNCQSNLEWMTPKENSEHAWKNLPAATIAYLRERRSVGAKTMNRKKRTLTPEQVASVRSLIAAGVSQTKTASAVGRTRSTVDRIIKGETYRD